jgi:DNA-binding CsgD family transcriptional regulator
MPVAARLNMKEGSRGREAGGMNTVEIAHKLQLSPKTIESHRKVIKIKLNVQTSAQLSRRAFQWVQ